MQKLLISLSIILITIVSSGCATWDAVKEDSKNAYDSTKEAIHDATK